MHAFIPFWLTSDVFRRNKSVVFAFQLPLPREGIELDFSRWMSNLLTIITPEMAYASEMRKPGASSVGDDYINGTILMDVRLAVKKGDGEWREYASKKQLKRSFACSIRESKRIDGYLYDCDSIELFELQSLYYDFYLINLQFLGGLDADQHFGILHDVSMVAIHQNGGFTRIWLSMKTVFAVISLSVLVWYWKRLHQERQNRSWILLEKALIGLGVALVLLNLPLEFLSLWLDFPFNNFLSDLRQGVFYCTLFSFWIIFTGEHLLDGANRSRLSSYYKPLAVVLTAFASLFVFDSIERGIQGYDPFFTVWQTETSLAVLFLMTALACAVAYFAYLCYHIYLVLASISSKSNSLPSMSMTRRMVYQGIIFRFKFLLQATLVCAALTLIAFLVGQWNETRMQWEMDLTSGGERWEWKSAMFSTVYAMCNCYVLTLLILYAPSHKEASNDVDTLSEEVEFSRLTSEGVATTRAAAAGAQAAVVPKLHETSEMKLLQTLSTKQAFD